MDRVRPATMLDGAITPEKTELEKSHEVFAEMIMRAPDGKIPKGYLSILTGKYRDLLTINPRYPPIMHAVLSVLETIEAVAESEMGENKKKKELWKKLGLEGHHNGVSTRNLFICSLVAALRVEYGDIETALEKATDFVEPLFGIEEDAVKYAYYNKKPIIGEAEEFRHILSRLKV